MSYSNGIGDLKQALSTIAPTSSQATDKVATEKARQSDSAAPRGAQADEARLSSTSGLVAQALEGSDVRADKVAALKEAIQSGTYNVPSSAVAEKMIQTLLD